MQITNRSGKVAQWITLLGCAVVMLVLAGCAGVTKNSAGANIGIGTNNVFAVGETIDVMFSMPTAPPPPYEERIKDDGTIMMPLVGVIHAAGKSPGDLQKELQTQYERFYNNITVTVKDQDRYFYVDGEVQSRGPKLYLSDMDIIQALSAAGGFTDYAKRTRVHLIRNGKTEIINCVKAIDDPRYDVKVYPGDKIVVPRRLW